MAQTSNGRHLDLVESINLNPTVGTTITANAVSAVYELGDKRVLRVVVVVSAVSTDDSIIVTAQGSRDGVNDWYSLGATSSITGAGSARIAVPLDRFVRLSFAVSGSDVSIGVSATGEAA